jgi:hypothetical protein
VRLGPPPAGISRLDAIDDESALFDLVPVAIPAAGWEALVDKLRRA